MYPDNHDVSFLGVQNLTWRAVECPVGDLGIQFVFSSTTNTKYFFSVHLWDMMVPASKVEVRARCEDGTYFWKALNFSANGARAASRCLAPTLSEPSAAFLSRPHCAVPPGNGP